MSLKVLFSTSLAIHENTKNFITKSIFHTRTKNLHKLTKLSSQFSLKISTPWRRYYAEQSLKVFINTLLWIIFQTLFSVFDSRLKQSQKCFCDFIVLNSLIDRKRNLMTFTFI